MHLVGCLVGRGADAGEAFVASAAESVAGAFEGEDVGVVNAPAVNGFSTRPHTTDLLLPVPRTQPVLRYVA